MNVRIVEATPEHSEFLAFVTLTAFRSHLPRGFWDFMLPGDDEARLRYLTALVDTKQRHWCHREIALIAEVDGQPAAASSGYFDEEHGGERFGSGLEEADGAVSRETDPARLKDGLTILSVAPEHPAGTWIVENVATKPEFRRRGLIDRLLTEIVRRGRERGATISDVSVFIGNDSAQRAYERAGYRVISEKRDPAFEAVYACPGTRTLRRTLSPADEPAVGNRDGAPRLGG